MTAHPFDDLTREEAIAKLREAWDEIGRADDRAFMERQRHAREALRLLRRIDELEGILREKDSEIARLRQ